MLDHVAKLFVGTATQFCQACDSPAVWASALNLARQGAHISDTSFERYLSDSNLGFTASVLQDGAISALQQLVETGATVAADRLVASGRGHYPLEERINTLVQRLMQEQATLLPSSSQKWLMKQTGKGETAARFDYTNPADSPEIRQAAALLLFMFDRKDQDSSSTEAYERYRSLCEMHFRLFLLGRVGEVTTF